MLNHAMLALAVLCFTGALRTGYSPQKAGLVLHAATKGRLGQQQAGGTKPRTPTKRDRMLDGLLESVDFTRSKQPPQLDINDDPLLPMVKTVALAADKRKAGVINSFRISHITEITTFMVIIEGNSRPQNQAIALAIEVNFLGHIDPDICTPQLTHLHTLYLSLHVPQTHRRMFYSPTLSSHLKKEMQPVDGSCLTTALSSSIS
jgi:hypothetical protein